jgi:hypothetical protein
MIGVLIVLGSSVIAGAVAFIVRTLRPAGEEQRRRDDAFGRWIAAGGHEAGLHEDSGSATVVVLDVRSVREDAGAGRALTDGAAR